MKLLVQPGNGVGPLIKAIDGSKKSVEIFIFRFDRNDIEQVLAKAVNRGVFVHALIAYTNRGGEKNLRKLEMKLLGDGITVTRTSNDLARYHGKLIIVDRRELYLLAFNFTYMDIMRSRSFGLIIENQRLVEEAVKLFEADCTRRHYSPSSPAFVISPLNARKQLSSFIQGAKKELLIYDPKVSDPLMIKLLEQRAAAGVGVKIIGRLTRKKPGLLVRDVPKMILHTRTIIRDRDQAFIGSQSLREAELDARREVGIIFRDEKVITQLIKTFEEDWGPLAEQAEEKPATEAPVSEKAAKKVAKALAKELPPVAQVLKQVVKDVVGENSQLDLNTKQVEESVKEAVRAVVKDVVQEVVQEAVEQKG